MNMRFGLLGMALALGGAGLFGCNDQYQGDATDSRVMSNSDAAGALVNPNNRPNLRSAYGTVGEGEAGSATPESPNVVGAVPGVGTSNEGAQGAFPDNSARDSVNITGTGQSITGPGSGAGNSGSRTGTTGTGTGTGGNGGAGTGSTGAGGGAGGGGAGGGGGR